jgi:hypothetical protein
MDAFSGVRNDVTPERFKPEDLASAVNVELDETGKPQRRLGVTEVDGTSTHSLWAKEDHCLCVRGGNLHRMNVDTTFTNLGMAIRGTRVAYRRVNNTTYFTDNIICGRYDGNTASSWGGSRVTATNVQLLPPLPGVLLGFYNGRIYVGRDNYLWYTEPYDYEHVNLAMNFLGFTAPVTTFAPVSDGVYVGTSEETSFLAGSDPKDFVRKPVSNYGTLLGTEVELPAFYLGGDEKPAKPVQAWMSKKGLCVGLDGGEFMNLTGERFLLPEGVATGASLFKLRGGSPQLVTTLFS